uniref:NADH-ubiquinone oxidoreductase chain 6 n=1 Tax=Condylostylus luteicoxa TaxID=2984119 RepID=A0A977XVI0_9MUSC|nr:NADH dehydrogenase subunit 6 [Condylostylus luteicoxa]UXX49975.1 NADH dehydrogenase subunit 6 [Condylostylus luteicoxa]
MIMSSLIFMQMNHPLAMGLMLLIQTLMISLASGIMAKSFWFSYIIFLVFLGGLLVLFIYVTSLASNEMFSMSMKITLLILTFSFMTVMILLVLDFSIINSFMENSEMIQLSENQSYCKENSLILSKIYNYPTNLLTIILINYLLITLIAIVKITNVFYGPLRQMN